MTSRIHRLGLGLLLIPVMLFGAEVKTQLTTVSHQQLSGGSVQITLTFSKPLTALPKHFSIKKANQVVLDFWGVSAANPDILQTQEVQLADVKRYGMIEADKRLRLTVQLMRNLQPKMELKGRELRILFSGKAKKTASTRQRQMSLKAVDFSVTKDTSQLVLDFNHDAIDIDMDQGYQTLTLYLKNVQVPSRLVKRIDVLDFNAAVQFIDVLQERGKGRIAIQTAGPFSYFSYQLNNKLFIDIQPLDNNRKATGGKTPLYDGKKISLNFQKITVRAVLQVLADFTGINMVVSDAVAGEISLKLDAVPWDQALDIILKTQGLAKRYIGDIMLIAPSKEIVSRETEELQSLKKTEELVPLQSKLIQVNYAKAEEIAKLLKDKNNTILSTRGQVSVDTRTNMLWLKDTAVKVDEVRALIQQLDIPVQQVMIETRIVDVDTSFQRDLGVRFGVSSPNHLSGSLAGANALASGTALSQVNLASRLNVDLPPNVTTGTAPGIGLALAKLGSNVFLDLELKAMESEDKGTIISSPHVVTMDRHTATIESGEDIPFNESTSSGAASIAFKKAVLKLEVTPHITPDKKVILLISIHNDRKGEPLGNNVIIVTKAIETKTLVDNGETIVLGGIYKRDDRDKVVRVPFLGRLPLVGNLFRNTTKTRTQRELLIFITPKILDPKIA